MKCFMNIMSYHVMVTRYFTSNLVFYNSEKYKKQANPKYLYLLFITIIYNESEPISSFRLHLYRLLAKNLVLVTNTIYSMDKMVIANFFQITLF